MAGLILTLLIVALATFGALGLGLLLLLSRPLVRPAPLASVQIGALKISGTARPALEHFQARDGTRLAFRHYRAEADKLAILVHGSAGQSDQMHDIASELATHGIAAVAVDMRGHGASGQRGDIAYLGQLDDDLEDLTEALRPSYPTAPITLFGHSSGGGFVLGIAASKISALFQMFVLLSPYLGHDAPTTRRLAKGEIWAAPNIPRFLALQILGKFGSMALQGLPTIVFATSPAAQKFVTSSYSYRLMVNFGPPPDWAGAFAAGRGKISVITGTADEMFDGPAYKSALEPLGVPVTLLPDLDHMGVVYHPAALAAIVRAVL